jgi:hypothetical protein
MRLRVWEVYVKWSGRIWQDLTRGSDPLPESAPDCSLASVWRRNLAQSGVWSHLTLIGRRPLPSVRLQPEEVGCQSLFPPVHVLSLSTFICRITPHSPRPDVLFRRLHSDGTTAAADGTAAHRMSDTPGSRGSVESWRE